jgi:D-alanyl-D-alanine carboxypeptidase
MMSLSLCLRSGAVTLMVLVAGCAGCSSALAARATLLVDMDSGAVLHADAALRSARPASLTKLMTLYVAFAAVRDGQLSSDEPVTMSAAAAAAPPVRLGLKAAASLTVDAALTGIIVSSGNDVAVAVALAEAVAGTEAAFVLRMNAAAERLGLTGTRFTNASGLPDPGQVTTARNLVATATRNGRHLVGVVLGEAAAAAAARDQHMVRMMNAGFAGKSARIHVRCVSRPTGTGSGRAG